MKLSNYTAVGNKISERNKLINQRNALQKSEWKLFLLNGNGNRIEVTTDAMGSIISAMVADLDQKIANIHFELKELGVYTDTNEPVGTDYYNEYYVSSKGMSGLTISSATGASTLGTNGR